MTGRTWRLVLTLSLLLNVFAVGAVGGAIVARDVHPFGRARPFGVQRAIRAAAVGLPEADRARFEATIRDVLVEGRTLARTARQDRRDAAILFVAPRFDAEAVTALLAAARDADGRLQARLDDAAIAFAATLPLDERANLAAGLAHGGPLRHPRR